MKVFKTGEAEYVIKYRRRMYALNSTGWIVYSTLKPKVRGVKESSLLDILITAGKTRNQIEVILDRLHEELKPIKDPKVAYQAWAIGAIDSNAKCEDSVEFNFSVKFTDENEVVITDESCASPTTNTPDSCASPGSKMEKS